MDRLATDFFSFGVHGITGRDIDEGTLPAGTLVRNIEYGEPNEDGAVPVRFEASTDDGETWYTQRSYGRLPIATKYYASAYQTSGLTSGRTLIPGMDGPARDSIAEARQDITGGYRWEIRAIDPEIGDRPLTDEEVAESERLVHFDVR